MITFIVRLSNDKDIVYFCDAKPQEIVDAYKKSCDHFNFQFHERIAGDPEDRTVIASEDVNLPEDVYLRLLEEGCPFNELSIKEGTFKEDNIGSLFGWFLTKGFDRPIEITVASGHSMLFNYFKINDDFTPLTIGNVFSKTTHSAPAFGGGRVAYIQPDWNIIQGGVR